MHLTAYTLSWPSAESGALPVEGGVAIAFKKEIENSENPDEKRKELEDLLSKRSSPFPRAENFSVHELIDPIETRPKLISWIELAIKSQTPQEPYKTTMLPNYILPKSSSRRSISSSDIFSPICISTIVKRFFPIFSSLCKSP